jgi:lipid-binding SYLF domain-containing protein
VFSRPSFFRITGASAGVQVGVQSVDVVMLLMTDASVNAFVEGRAQLGATTSIAAGPVGREAQASSDVTFSAEVLYYSRASGLFVGLDFSGTVLEPDEESARAFYGDPRDFRALLRDPPPPPPAWRAFVDEVERSFAAK